MLATLLAALIAVESGGDPAAIGDRGRAIGILQIHPGVVQDVNRVYGTTYTTADRRDPAKSRQLCALYLQHWGRQYEKETGRRPTPEVFARIWNGGPRGWERSSTRPYWEKVRRVMP